VKKRILVFAAAILATIGLGFTGASPAHAAASPWYTMQLQAAWGNGCTFFQNPYNEQRLAPIVSAICEPYTQWQVRDLTRETGDIRQGDHIEIATDDLKYAWGYSGGLEKLQTPNLDYTFLVVYQIGQPAGKNPGWLDLAIPGVTPTTGFDPTGNQEDLPIETPQPDWSVGGDAWTLCAPAGDPQPWTCASGGVLT
jgi:hypothetical protein